MKGENSLKNTPEELTEAIVDSSEEASTDDEMAARVDEIMKKYDRESNVRIWEGIPKWIITAVLASFSILCLYIAHVGCFLKK